MEPPKKVIKTADLELKEMICSMQEIFFSKLKSIEEKIDKISTKYLTLEKKVDDVICTIQGAPITLSNSSVDNSFESENFTMYTEEDYPDGSWLGDPENPEFRVRCPIPPKDLEHINNTCTSAEKMSLTLLDNLFPREIQACSNLSGTGKHGKKQLDPFKIEGIKYHITHMFGITENDWNRIKLNIDSKCRTAFRRKLKGMPLSIRGGKGRLIYQEEKKDENSDQIVVAGFHNNLNSESEIKEKETRSNEDSLACVLPIKIDTISPIAFPISSEHEVLHTEHGSIQVIRATKEQFEMLKQNPNIEVLQQSILSS